MLQSSSLPSSESAAPAVDWTCATGAAALKLRIESYWKARGFDVQVMLVDSPFSTALRATRVDVRSELINGLPRAALERQRPTA